MVRQFSTFGLAENGLSINLFRTSLSKRKLNSSAIHVVLQRGQYIYFTEYCKPEDTFQKTFFWCVYVGIQPIKTLRYTFGRFIITNYCRHTYLYQSMQLSNMR